MNYPKPNIFTINKNKLNRSYPNSQVLRYQNVPTQSRFCSYQPTSKSDLVKKSIESSNKLDELLNKCKSIGSSSSLSLNFQKPTSPPIQNNPSKLTKITNYKLIKQIRSPKPESRLVKENPFVLKTTSRFKLVKQKTKPVKINLNSLVNNSIVNFIPTRSRFFSKNQTIYWQARKRYKYKLTNLKNFIHQRPQKSRLKLVNNQLSRVNKYRVINTTSSNRTRNETNKKILLANNLINRSKLTINRTLKKVQTQSDKNKMSLNNKAEKKYCLFYNRFGRCSRGENCPYIHDPQRVSLCPRFLRGTCKVENCPFSHETNPEKIPVCSFFASGRCNRENCPYKHVFYGKDARFCIDFAKGHCPLGSKCENLHLIECPEFEKSNKCPRGKKCPLLHRKKKTQQKKNQGLNQIENGSLSFVPDFKTNSDENIKIFETKESKNDSNETFKLRPSFKIKKL